MTVPEARNDPVLRRYQLRSQRVPLGARSLGVVIPAAREWLRRGTWVGRMRPEDEPPYWVEIWPAALAAVWALARLPAATGLRVLDLGCGLGLPGVAAAALGSQVTFCDCEADALAFASWNARRQARDPDSVAVVCGDWRRVSFAAPFDLIVMADVTYRTDHLGALQSLVQEVLAPSGMVLHADPTRAESTEFLTRLARLGHYREHLRTVQHGDRKVAVRLALAGRGAAADAVAAWSDGLGSPAAARASSVAVAAEERR